MGLDMYLTKRTYVQNWDHTPEDKRITITISKNFSHIKPERITYIIEEVAYWRKFNALHKWFVDNVQDGIDNCGEYSITVEQLKELLIILERIKNDNKLAEELLPSQGGFFFGSTDYDEWYFKDVEETYNTISSILKEEAVNEYSGYYYYQSSW